MILTLETLMSIIRTSLPILVELINLVNSLIFLSQMTLLRWLTFFLGSQALVFPPLGNSYHFVVSVSIKFPSNLQWDSPFCRIAYDYSCADWDGLRDHLRDVPWEDIFRLSASAAVSEFCK